MKMNSSKSLVYFLLFVAIIPISILNTSCKKETVRETFFRDTVIIKHDSIITRYDVLKWMTKKWTLTNHEYELYSGNVLVSKKQESFNGLGYYIQYKADGTTTSYDLGGLNSGSWQLLSDNYYVLDKNSVNERYYYILSISQTNLIVRGPFTQSNALYSNYLTTGYLISP